MPLWLIHLLAAATALALAEHWLRYVLVERKRHRRAVDRLERIRRNREAAERRREDAEWAKYLAGKAEPRLAESLYAQMQAEQARAMQGVGGLGSQAAQLMTSGLAAGIAAQDRPWLSNTGTMQTGTGPYDLWVADRMDPRRK